MGLFAYWLVSDTQPSCQVTIVTQTGLSAHTTTTRSCGLPGPAAFIYILAPVVLLLLPDAKRIQLGGVGLEMQDVQGVTNVAVAVAEGDTLTDSEPAEDVLGQLLGWANGG